MNKFQEQQHISITWTAIHKHHNTQNRTHNTQIRIHPFPHKHHRTEPYTPFFYSDSHNQQHNTT